MSLPPLVPFPASGGTMQAAPFRCTWSPGANAAWVHLEGELDLAGTPHLERTLADAQLNRRLVVLDPRELTFIDCSAIHAIVDSAGRARREGGWLLLMVASPLVERLLALTGGHDLVTIFDVELDLGPGVSPPYPQPIRRWRKRSGPGRHGGLRAVRDNAEDVGFPSRVHEQAWSRPTPGRGHAIKPVRPG